MITLAKQYDRYLETNKFIEYSVFKNIIELHNKKVIKEIIEKGRSFNMGNNLGSLHILEKERKAQTGINGQAYTSINWLASLKKKKELLAEGKIPLEMNKDEKGIIIGDNGGEKWQIYNTSLFIYKFFWSRYRRKGDIEGGFVSPLKRIRHYHLQIVRTNIRDMNRFAHNNNISYKVAA